MRRHSAIVLVILVVAASFALLAACGNGNKPAIEPATTYPSTAASPGTSPGATSPSPSPATLTPGSSPTAPGADGGGGDQITDASIKAAILRRIAESPALAGLRIRVAVKDRTVRLGGNVKTAAQKAEAEQIAVTEPGIAKVVSYLVIESQGDGGY